VLVVDDHIEMARVLERQLTDLGHAVDVATGTAAALEIARDRPPDAVITDLRMEGLDGLDLLDRIHAMDATIPVIIMTAFGAIDSAIDAVKRGAYHYITKPLQLQEVRIYLERALADRQLRTEYRQLRRWASERSGLESMVGKCAVMRALYDLVERVAPVGLPALVRGESGTGKELVARALHFVGPRRDRPFVPVNCTALPESLLESELFGHIKGAFTGATAPRRGLFVEADGGTLYLDEIGDMPTNLQAKLLRVLEDGEIRSVGSDGSRKVDVRVIASTNQPIEKRIQEGRFRADLFYRLNVLPISVPPLRERVEDLPILVAHFLDRIRGSMPEIRLRRFSPGALGAMSRHPWPGNVRELENVVQRLAVVSVSEVAEVEDLAKHAAAVLDPGSSFEYARAKLIPLEQLEEEYIAWVIQQCGGNKTRAAEILGIDVSTIRRREKR
jgi:two-component system response regulator HydG